MYKWAQVNFWMIAVMVAQLYKCNKIHQTVCLQWINCMVDQLYLNTSVACCSVGMSCPTLCDPMDCSTSGFPVLHHLPELAQTHIHQVGDAIQPSHPLSSPSPPAFNFLSIRVFFSELTLCIRWPKYWSFNFSISPSNEYQG